MATGATAMPVTVPQNLLCAIANPLCGTMAAAGPPRPSIGDRRGHHRSLAPAWPGGPSFPSTREHTWLSGRRNRAAAIPVLTTKGLGNHASEKSRLQRRSPTDGQGRRLQAVRRPALVKRSAGWLRPTRPTYLLAHT